MSDEAIAQARRLYMHVKNSGRITAMDMARLVAAMEQMLAERDRFQAGLLRMLQYENKCDQTGKPCDASSGCACSLEAESWCNEDET